MAKRKFVNLKKAQSVGQAVRAIRSGKAASVYTLFGSDAWLQNFIIKEVKAQKPQAENFNFSLDVDSDLAFFGELQGMSLFASEKVISLRDVRKLKSKKAQESLLQYAANPISEFKLILLSDNEDPAHAFMAALGEASTLVDVRSPIGQKMFDWVNHICALENYRIHPELRRQLVDQHADSVASVMNEIEKLHLQFGDAEEILPEHLQADGAMRRFNLEDLDAALLKRDLLKSMRVLESLLEFGTSAVLIIVNLHSLFQHIFWLQTGLSELPYFTGLKPRINAMLRQSARNFSNRELVEIIRELQSADRRLKSTSIKPIYLLHGLIVKITKREYA